MGWYPRIMFLGQDYVLVDDCVIATEDAFLHGRCSFAVLMADGTIRRFGCVIGKKDDRLKPAELLGVPNDTPLMVQWQGRWRSDFFRMTVDDYRRAHAAALKGSGGTDAQRR